MNESDGIVLDGFIFSIVVIIGKCRLLFILLIALRRAKNKLARNRIISIPLAFTFSSLPALTLLERRAIMFFNTPIKGQMDEKRASE